MEESPVPPFNSRPRLKSTGPSRMLGDLPESLIYLVLAQVSEGGGGFSHALVCQKWARVSMEAQRRVDVREGASVADSDLLNELRDLPNLRELQLKRLSAIRLTDRFFLGIGATCPRLESITILDDSSEKMTEFSTEGVRGMISSLPGLKSIVLKVECGREWDVPDSVSSLRSLKVLLVEPRWKTHRSVLRIPPSIRELGPCNRQWVVANDDGLQELRLLIIEAFATQEIPEALWTACSLRSLRMDVWGDCPHLSEFVSRLTALRQLQLYTDRADDPPDCFSTLQSLTHLRLASRHAETLPESLWSLTSLKHLSLDCDKLMSIDTGVGRLQGLTSLYVSSGQEFNFPSSLRGLSALIKLELHLPRVQPGFEVHARALTDAIIVLHEETDLSRFLRGCPSLSRLCLEHKKDASSLLGDGGLFPSLQHLTMYGPSILQQARPNSFSGYSNLETLEIVNCQGIVELPWRIGECGRLTKLTVYMCHQLCKLPPGLGSLRNLRKLRIEDCPELQCVPQTVGQLSSLEHLELGRLRNLRSIPNSLGSAHRLRTFEVSCCTKLNCLPKSVGQFAQLTSFSVQHCPLVKELPGSMSQLLSLNKLELAGLPALQSLPKGVQKITTLHSLTVRRCMLLQELPDLGQLMNLRNVVIEDCLNLRHLPPSLGDLLQLKRLHLKDLSGLPSIPQQIGQLSSLRDLLIQNLPSLTSLPDSMTQLTGLAELVIKDCHSLAWVPELLESLSEISEESKVGLRALMETGALRGVQQRRSRRARRSREVKLELGARGMT